MTLRTLLARTALLGSVGLAVLAATAYLPPSPPTGYCSWSTTEQKCVLVGHYVSKGWVCVKNPDTGICGCLPQNTPPGGWG